jgi:RNA exonuclease 1
MKRTSDKKIKKLENKKRKISAFIDLINNEKEVQNNETIASKEDNINGTDNDEKESHVFTSNYKQMSELRKKLSIRLSKERPKFYLEINSNETNANQLLSVYDIQSFLLACLLPGPRLSCPPNWCKVLKPTKASKVAIFAFDCDLTHEVFNETDFKHKIGFEVNDDWINSLLNVPLSNRQLQKLHLKSNKWSSDTNGITISSEERISRTKLLLSPLQLTIEKYPILSSDDNYSNFNKTKTKYSPVNDSSPIYSLDCEMCYTSAQKLEVTRISVVNENCEVIYDTLVKPKNKIINYLTKYSGVTKKLLDPINVTLDDVHKHLDRILPEDAILCGQSLNSDLQALQLIHPYIIDTSVIYNLTGFRHVKSSLKHLSFKFLNMDIQNNDSDGHDSTEDAIAAMKLVKLKLNMGLGFGDKVLLRKDPNFIDLNSTTMSITSYLERLNTKLSVYYDHIDIESNDKLLTIFSSVSNRNTNLSETINRLILTDKAICVVLNKSGQCFIKF